jgi:hypothetical protein
MFKSTPRILAHSSAIKHGNLITPKYILHQDNDSVTLMNRFCPHRMYPIGEVGDVSMNNHVCNFHGFEWKIDGTPINNNRNLKCGKANIGRSGLVLHNFNEPNHYWVDNLASETNLSYSHTCQGTSKGSWLWMMEIQADLLHIRRGNNAIHPWLSSIEDLDNVNMEEGDNWIIQTCSTGWWLFIYPFTFIEWSKGCLAVNYTVPHNINDEYGFDWITQFYYDSVVTPDRKVIFEKLEDIFREDVQAIEKQKSPYFPIIRPYNRLENHCVHYGKWVKANRVAQ